MRMLIDEVVVLVPPHIAASAFALVITSTTANIATPGTGDTKPCNVMVDDLVDAADTAANEYAEKFAQEQNVAAEAPAFSAVSGSAQRPLQLGPANAAQGKVVTNGIETRVLFPCPGILRMRAVAEVLA